MTSIPPEKTTDKTKVSGLTVGELKAIIHEILSEKFHGNWMFPIP